MLDISPFVNKQFRKAIMAQTRLLNTYKKHNAPKISLPIKDGQIFVLSF